MGDNILTTQIDDEPIPASDINQYRTAMVENHVPRNNSGIPTNEAGVLGSDSYKWLKSFIQGGCWSAGDIKAHHTYNGSSPIGFGWFPCNGSVIDQANYDAIFGIDAWATYVISSPLENKYSPNLESKYLIGTATTSQDGSSVITTVGNTDNQLDYSHVHNTQAHNHQWYANAGAASISLLRDGTPSHDNRTFDSAGNKIQMPIVGTGFAGDFYTDNQTVATASQSNTIKSIRPESIEVIYYIRIV